MESDVAVALAHSRLVPFMLRDTADVVSLPGREVLRAFGLLGDRRWLPYVQWASEQLSFDTHHDAIAAWARARLGDTTRLGVLRQHAVQSAWTMDRNWAADALRELGDTAIVRLMFERVRRERVVWPLGWLHRTLPPAQWLTFVRDVAASPAELGVVLLWYYYFYAPREQLGDGTLAPYLKSITHAALAALPRDSLAEGNAEARNAALFVLERLRDVDGLPVLIPLVSADADTYARVSGVLIRMTGVVDSLPGTPGSGPAQRAEARRFWERWWAGHGTGLRVAPSEVGGAAEARWWRRGGGRRF